jgi:hypothetical protein
VQHVHLNTHSSEARKGRYDGEKWDVTVACYTKLHNAIIDTFSESWWVMAHPINQLAPPMHAHTVSLMVMMHATRFSSAENSAVLQLAAWPFENT